MFQLDRGYDQIDQFQLQNAHLLHSGKSPARYLADKSQLDMEWVTLIESYLRNSLLPLMYTQSFRMLTDMCPRNRGPELQLLSPKKGHSIQALNHYNHQMK